MERLFLDIERERHRMRARHAGINLRARRGTEDRARAEQWILQGAPVPDEQAYLAWLERQLGLVPG